MNNGIDVMREGLMHPKTRHIRTFFVRDALEGGVDQELSKSGRPTCTEEEIHSWVYVKQEEGKVNREMPDQTCDDHGLDAWRYDEILNFVHGFGRSMEPKKEWAEGTYGAMYDRMMGKRREEDQKRGVRRKKWKWGA